MRCATVLLFVPILFSCGQSTGHSSPENEVVNTLGKTDTSLFVVIPFDKTQGWMFDKTYKPTTLSEDDLIRIPLLLGNTIAKYNKGLLSLNKIDLMKTSYRMQYVPAVSDKGEKVVWVNCFCEDFSGWRISIIQVDDGGTCFFNLKINLTTGLSYDMVVNGNA